MVFHFNPAWLPGGFIGVDVFLVISGFLITSILLKKKSQPDYALGATIRYFYASRLKRIAPAYFVMLVLVALVAAVFFVPEDFDTFKGGLEKAAWFNSNHYFADFGDYFAPANHEQPLLHTWSLAVEIQFYLLAPLLILLLPLTALKWVLLALTVVLTLVAEYRMRVLGIEQITYYSLYARLPEFFAGCLASLYLYTVNGGGKKAPWLSGLGLILILFAAVAQPVLGHFPGIAALIPVQGCVLVLINTSSNKANSLLSSKGLVWVGALSYSLYLWHWPVLAFLRYYTGAEVLDLSFSLLFVLVTLLLAIASYYGVEQLLRASAKPRWQRLGLAVLALAVLGTSQSMAKVNDIFTPEQFPIEYRRYADPATICHGKIVGDCLRGDLTSNREVLVLGDSHAAMLNHFFDYLGKELGFKARIITASSCVTIPGFDYQRIAEWAHEACKKQIEAAGKYISGSPIIILAGSWSGQTKSEKFNKALNHFLHNHPRQQIYLLSQVPRFDENVIRMQRFEAMGFITEVSREVIYKTANERVSGLASQYSNVKFLALDEIRAFENAPFYEDEMIYSDHHHLNEVGARIYAVGALSYLKPLFKVN